VAGILACHLVFWDETRHQKGNLIIFAILYYLHTLKRAYVSTSSAILLSAKKRKQRNFSIMYYTYILYSSSKDVYYKGSSSHPEHRLWEHNNDKSSYTSGKGPWIMVYKKAYETKREALIEEKRVKRLNRKSIERLIAGIADGDQAHIG
jgi:putative endonuclease